MPRAFKVPRLHRHKATGQAYVEIRGRRFYLGRFDAPDAEERYRRFVAEYATFKAAPPRPGDALTVNELIALYWRHLCDTYRDVDGKPSREAQSFRHALKHVRELYGASWAREFGPLKLKAVRERMISLGWTRGHVNQQVRRSTRMFRWAAENELLDGERYHALRAIEPLRFGRTEAPEGKRVAPPPIAHVDAALARMPRPVAAVARLQILTGARPGELLGMRPADVERSGDVWTYRPRDHKTKRLGHAREIFLGPRAQGVLAPFLERPADAFCFSPREAMEEWRAARHAARKTPASCGNVPGSNKKRRPRKTPGERYGREAYWWAVARACDAAEVPRWHPHQLRHLAGTEFRARFGPDAARALLGHRSLRATEIYAEVDAEKAKAAMLEVG